MPEHIRALIVILGIACTTFLIAKGPLTTSIFTETEFKRYRNRFIAITLLLFLSNNFWIFAFATGVLLLFSTAKEQQPLSLYFAVLFAVPHSFSAPIPGIAGINFLINLDFIRLLNLCILLPFAIKLHATPNNNDRNFRAPNILLTIYSLYIIVMFAFSYNFTGTLRSIAYIFMDIWLPYYVATRALSNIKDFNTMSAAIVMGVCICAAIGIFETIRFWLVYESLRGPLSMPPNQYLLRGGTGLLRAQSSTGQAIIFGYVAMIGIGFTAVLIPLVKHRLQIWASGLVMLGGLVASLSRGPWVGAAFMLFLLFALRRGLSRYAVLIMNLGVLGIVILLSPLGQKVIDFLPFVGTVDEGSVTYRQQLWQASVRAIADNPWFGDIYFIESPHLQEMRQGQGIIDIVNSYLQYALQFGLVGLSLFLLLVLVTIKGVWRTRKLAIESKNTEVELVGRVLLAVMGGVLVTIATVSSLFSIPTIYWLLVGISVWYTRQFGYESATKKVKENTPKRSANLPQTGTI